MGGCSGAAFGMGLYDGEWLLLPIEPKRRGEMERWGGAGGLKGLGLCDIA